MKFDLNGGTSAAIAGQRFEKNTPATKPADPTWDKHIFKGWFNSAEAFDFETPVTEDLTLTASWVESVDVTFQLDGGKIGDNSDDVKIVVQKGTTIPTDERPADPSRENYEFQGWFADNATVAFDFTTVLSADVVLTARWAKAVARIGDGDSAAYYTALPEAIAASKAGDTITLLENITASETIAISASQIITLDLNGKDITGAVKAS